MGEIRPVFSAKIKQRGSEVASELFSLDGTKRYNEKKIRTHLQLNKPIYEQTAAYGHFGRTHNSASGAFSWEALDLVSDFKSLA